MLTYRTPPVEDIGPVQEIADHVLWLSTAIIHHANRIRPNPSGLKVGGHQASCASMVSIMTSLYFGQLQAGDRVSVKPHASPVLHAINYLLGELDEAYLTRLRDFGGLQSYPSRTKDPDPVDYSTGSVGIGATAPIWGAIARRYVDVAFGATGTGRQYSLVGDAELDEGAVWEAILEPSVAELGEIVWIVDMNRQSLDRVVPNIAAGRLASMFSAAGWQVIDVKFGRRLEALFKRAGGPQLRRRILDMPNPEYQRLLRCSADELRTRLPGDGPGADEIARLIAELDDNALSAAISNLGGHDLDALREAYAQIDDTRPTVIIAYTIKGYGLPIQGHPQNHSSLLTDEQFDELAASLGKDATRPWSRFDADTPPDVSASTPESVCAAVRSTHDDGARGARGARPHTIGRHDHAGRAGPDAAGSDPGGARGRQPRRHGQPRCQLHHQSGRLAEQGRRLVARRERRNWFDDDAETIMHWRERPTGQHIELGIAETNLVGLIG